MGGHGINTRHLPSVSLLLNGKSFTTYIYSKPKRDLLLSRKKNLLPCLKLKVGRNFQDTDSCCMVYAPSSLGIHTPFLCLQGTSAENLRRFGAYEILSMDFGT